MPEPSREELIATHDRFVRKAVEDGFLPKEFADFAIRLRSDDDKVRIAKGEGIENDPAMTAFSKWLMGEELRWVRQQLHPEEGNGASEVP